MIGGVFGGGPQAGYAPQRKPWELVPVQHQLPQQPQPQQQQRWLDGGKFKGRDALALALGAIGDAFTGRPVTSQLILGNMQQRRQAEQQQLQAQQQRIEGREDKIWEWQNKPQQAPDPTTFQRDYQYILETQGPEAAQQYMANKVNPPVWRQGADGQFYRVETAQPQAFNPDDWEVVEGGAGGNASGGFRP